MTTIDLTAFREGVLVFSQPGALGASDLEHLIAPIEGLDMGDVRAQLTTRANA